MYTFYVSGDVGEKKPHVIVGIHNDWVLTVTCTGDICSLTPVLKQGVPPK